MIHVLILNATGPDASSSRRFVVAGGVGSAALAGLLAEDGLAGPTGALANRHFVPKPNG